MALQNTNVIDTPPGAKGNKYTSSFVLLTLLFFIWGFLTVMNDILIPYLKGVFQLNHAQAMLVQTSFFLAYFSISLLYFIFSSVYGDLINKIGYKNGIIIGLVTSALGLFLFYPAAQFQQYGFFLAALFVLGTGFTLLQIAANPYVTILGPPETASSRLNLAQALNSFGTTIAPVTGGYMIFEIFARQGEVSADAVKIPYLIFGGFVVLAALLILLAPLPAFTNNEKVERGAGALKFPQLAWGVAAIFAYVGGEVAVGSMLTSFLGLPDIGGMQQAEASTFVSLYWGGAMIGRFTGSVALSNMDAKRKKWLTVIVPFVVFPILLCIFYIKGMDIHRLYMYVFFIALMVGSFFAVKFSTQKATQLFAAIAALLIAASLFTKGETALWLIVSVGLFNSIMWSNIFAMSISGLGKYTGQGSSLLVMSILGGAVVPYIQGAVADSIGVHLSYAVPLVCYLFLFVYGWRMRSILKAESL
jgi:FHS family L-fucose permease-like MFS transporter